MVVVEGGGFEPPKRSAPDLQSGPFGHSGIPPGRGNGSGANECRNWSSPLSFSLANRLPLRFSG